jgi:hypothetical protein
LRNKHSDQDLRTRHADQNLTNIPADQHLTSSPPNRSFYRALMMYLVRTDRFEDLPARMILKMEIEFFSKNRI